MKQPSSLLNNVCSKCKVTYNFQEWQQNIKLQIFIQVNITVEKKLKTCQEQPHLLSGHFVVRTPPPSPSCSPFIQVGGHLFQN